MTSSHVTKQFETTLGLRNQKVRQQQFKDNWSSATRNMKLNISFIWLGLTRVCTALRSSCLMRKIVLDFEIQSTKLDFCLRTK